MVVLAQEEARTLKHNYIGTEHVLLGLLREEQGLAARALESLDITVDRVRGQVVRLVGSGEEITSGQIPFTPRAKKVLELALREALALGENYIDTEHILLGIVRENEGVAARILLDCGADDERIRSQVALMLSASGSRGRVVLRSSAPGPRLELDPSWLGGLAPALTRLGAEIERELGRAADSGDLLLALASAPDTRAAAALRSLGVDLEALAAAIEQARDGAKPSEAELTRKLAEVRRDKQRAVETQAFEAAAGLRDEERRLLAALTEAGVPPAVIASIRAALGLSAADG